MERYFRLFLLSILAMFGFINLTACNLGECDPSLPAACCTPAGCSANTTQTNDTSQDSTGTPELFEVSSTTGYTGPTLKIPMEPGDLIRCTTEAGGATMFPPPNDFDSWHTDSNNGYYSIDFDDRYSGDLVVAAADGNVDSMVNSGCYQYGPACYVKIDHGGGYKTLYYHLVEGSIPSDVYAGGSVTQGQVLGTIGTTGDSSGTHLHFSISYNGQNLSTTNGLSDVELDGTKFVDYVAGDWYDSTNDGSSSTPPASTTNSVHLMSVESNSSGKFNIYGYEVSGSGDTTTLSGDYFSYTNTGSTSTILSWLSGDVNNDGLDDVVQVRVKSGHTYAQVYLSNGTGGVNTQTRWKKTSGTASKAFLSDMNADGPADLVLGFPNSDSTMTWKYFTSTGSGFNDATDWTTSFGNSSDIFVIGDFNGNGKGELLRGREDDGVTDSNFTSTMTWKRLDTNNNTSTVLNSFGYSADKYMVTDVDGDSDDDFIRLDMADSTLTAYTAKYNSTSNQFDVPLTYATDVGDIGAQFFTDPIDYTDPSGYSYPDLIRFDGSNLKLLQNDSGTSFEEQLNESSLVSGMSSSATFLFGNFGQITSSDTTIQSIDGDSVDPVDDDDTSSTDTGTAEPTTTYYADADGDGYGDPGVSQVASTQPAGYVTNAWDCNDTTAGMSPGVPEVLCDGIDNDCNPGIPDDYDADGDGHSYCSGTDCNDSNANIYYGAPEICGNGVDDDCVGGDTLCSETYCADGADNDVDGYVDCADPDCTSSSDCSSSTASDYDGDGYDDSIDCGWWSANIYSGAPELADWVDNDCDGSTDENCNYDCGGVYSSGCSDDYESYYTTGSLTYICMGTSSRPADTDGDGYADSVDCAWWDAITYSGAPERSDWNDNDCDGTTDEGCDGSCGGYYGSGCHDDYEWWYLGTASSATICTP